jgi:C-terminal processing protease CtpA/Prc
VNAARLLILALLLPGCGGPAGVATVGAVFGRDNDTRDLYVREVAEGLGAEEAGLAPGDQIVMIDGVFVRDLDPPAIRAKLRGEVGTEVALTVVHGERVLHVRVQRRPPRARRPPLQKEERLVE